MDDWYEAGKLTSKAREYGKKLIKEKASLLDVSDKIEKYILDNNGDLAFPVQISLNEIAAHYAAYPGDDITFKKDDFAKLDLGVMVNGAIGDTATTVCIGHEESKMILASESALKEVLKVVRAGVTLAEVGMTIENEIKSKGFLPIKNLSGHSMDKYLIHAGLNIPNYDTGEKIKLKEGMVIAIEPFATTGEGFVRDGKASDIYRLVGKKSVRDVSSRQVLEYIWDNRKTLPFCKRQLMKKFPEFKVNLALKSLANSGILYSYPHLVERSGGLVSQAEHTVLVTKDGCDILTK